jgi:calcium-dependent protein kinase
LFIKPKQAVFSEKYTILKELGSGAYGVVLHCQEKETLREAAVKQINVLHLKQEAQERVFNEFIVGKYLDHPNIIRLYDVFMEESTLYIVTELYTGGELFDEIVCRQKFSELDAARLMRCIFSGVSYLHKNHILHRDLKPENLIFETKRADANIKIVDFGLAAFYDPMKKMKERLGTYVYLRKNHYQFFYKAMLLISC